MSGAHLTTGGTWQRLYARLFGSVLIRTQWSDEHGKLLAFQYGLFIHGTVFGAGSGEPAQHIQTNLLMHDLSAFESQLDADLVTVL